MTDDLRSTRADVTEKKMFGGLTFLMGGKMFCGIVKRDLMVRVGSNRYQRSLALPHVRPMDFTGRPMKGYVYVGPEGCSTQRMVRSWVDRGTAFVATLGGRQPRGAPERSLRTHRLRRYRSGVAGRRSTFRATLFRYPGP